MRGRYVEESAACAHLCQCVATEGEALSVHPQKRNK
jgi:hypothetical protein